METLTISIPEYANLKLPSPELLTYYSNLDERIIWIDDVIDANTLEVCKQIVLWNIEDSQVKVEERRPIRIMIDSPGGNLEESFALVDTIIASKTPVETIVCGTAYSGACLIFLAGDVRTMMPHSMLMIHQGSSHIVGTSQEVQSAAKNYSKTLDQMKEWILERCPLIDKATMNRKWKTGDWYLDCKEALTLGIATKSLTSLDEFIV